MSGTITRLTDLDTTIVMCALREYIRNHEEHHTTMEQLADAGGNGLVTAEGARRLAETHMALACDALSIIERVEDDELHLAYVKEAE